MSDLNYEVLEIGSELPPHICGPISRTDLALFAGGSGDHNPIHIDSDFAKKFGMDDVFAQGMLSMAYLAQLLTQWVDQQQLREYGVRFTSITPLYATVKCTGKVTEKFTSETGEQCLRVEVITTIDGGVQTLIGDAVIGFG